MIGSEFTKLFNAALDLYILNKICKYIVHHLKNKLALGQRERYILPYIQARFAFKLGHAKFPTRIICLNTILY